MVQRFLRGSGLVHDAAVQGEQPGTAADVRRMQLCCWVGLDYLCCILYGFIYGMCAGVCMWSQMHRYEVLPDISGVVGMGGKAVQLHRIHSNTKQCLLKMFGRLRQEGLAQGISILATH